MGQVGLERGIAGTCEDKGVEGSNETENSCVGLDKLAGSPEGGRGTVLGSWLSAK